MSFDRCTRCPRENAYGNESAPLLSRTATSEPASAKVAMANLVARGSGLGPCLVTALGVARVVVFRGVLM